MKKLISLVLGTGLIGSCYFVNNFSFKEDKLDYYSYILKHEGKRNEVYDPIPNDKKYEPTIGIGHYLDRPDSRETFIKVLPEVNYNDIYNKRSKLTDEQVKKLFEHDVLLYENLARNAFEDFDSFPPYLKEAIVDGFYRGDLAESPKTKKLINEGNFSEASKEYLRNKEYVNAKKNGKRGIISRMNSNSKAMEKYSREFKKRK